MVNFYRRYLPGVARTLQPLTDKLHGSRKGSEQVVWHAVMEKAFDAAKQALLAATHLADLVEGATLNSGGGCFCHASGGVLATVATTCNDKSTIGVYCKTYNVS